MRKIKSLKLQVNDNDVPTKGFVKEFIGNSLLGQIECLRLKDPNIQKVNLIIEYDD
ncbi:MAG: hypothetical protein ACW97X_11420 [Candidatus Hodarchaeales archaeon]